MNSACEVASAVTVVASTIVAVLQYRRAMMTWDDESKFGRLLQRIELQLDHGCGINVNASDATGSTAQLGRAHVLHVGTGGQAR